VRGTRAAAAVIGLAILASCGGCGDTGGGSPPPPPTSRFVRETGKNDAVIVFVHGLMGDAEASWKNNQTGASWPDLVGRDKELATADVYLVSYGSPAIGASSSVEQIAQRLLQQTTDARIFSAYPRVYFITHSMGGLVTKRMLNELYTPARVAELRKVRAVVFLSTPAQGAPLADIAAWISMNPQMNDLRPADFNTFLQSLENDWQTLLRDRDRAREFYPQAYCAYETLPTHGARVVTSVYAATRCDNTPYAMDFDHIAMAKPSDDRTDPYLWTKARLAEADRIATVSALVTRAGPTVMPLESAIGRNPEAWSAVGDTAWKSSAAGANPQSSGVAISAYERAARVDPSNAVYRAKIGSSLVALGRYQDALPHLERAVALDPTVAWYHNDLCQALSKLDRAAEADTACTAAVRIAPKDEEFQLRLKDVRRQRIAIDPGRGRGRGPVR
jgi:tetratricopeptide (TPR) repeat protein